jgi:hypothetical protein
MQITFVEQQDDFGCVPACLAMITGRTYEEVTADFHTDFSAEGSDIRQVVTYLGDAGFQVIEKQVQCYNNKNFGRDEIFKPFAHAHIVRVIARVDSVNGHVVVMTGDGKILCPAGFSEEEIKKSYHVTHCIGVFE